MNCRIGNVFQVNNVYYQEKKLIFFYLQKIKMFTIKWQTIGLHNYKQISTHVSIHNMYTCIQEICTNKE